MKKLPHTENDNVYEDCGLRGLVLLDKIIELIEEHPEFWDQRHWATIGVGEYNAVENTYVPATCGTAYCVAGWAVHMAGYQLGWKPRWEDWDSVVPTYFEATSCRKPDADYGLAIAEVARKLLEIDYDKGERLFNQYNTLADIKRIRDEIAEEVAEKQRMLTASFGNV